MSVVIQHRTYGYDNISAGNAYGQETNQSQFFPYTPGAVDPVADFEREPTGGSSYARVVINQERSGNSSPAVWGYGLEIP